MTMELLTIGQFSDKVGQTFTVEGLEPLVELTLIECSPLKNFANAARAPFSLIFTTQGVGALPQRMYDLRHAMLGLKPFFLVPIGQKGETVTYQAIFN